MERFKGKIIPARMLYDKSLLKDKRVLVLGGGKTSCGPLSPLPASRTAAEAALHSHAGQDLIASLLVFRDFGCLMRPSDAYVVRLL